jgi:hypothetical protein
MHGKTTLKIARSKLVQELNFLELTVQDVKLKVRAVRTGYAPALDKVIKSEQSDAALHDIYAPKLFCFKQAHSFLRGVCVPQTSVSTMALYVSNISKFTN